jgi:hypothetical protein
VQTEQNREPKMDRRKRRESTSSAKFAITRKNWMH